MAPHSEVFQNQGFHRRGSLCSLLRKRHAGGPGRDRTTYNQGTSTVVPLRMLTPHHIQRGVTAVTVAIDNPHGICRCVLFIHLNLSYRAHAPLIRIDFPSHADLRTVTRVVGKHRLCFPVPILRVWPIYLYIRRTQTFQPKAGVETGGLRGGPVLGILNYQIPQRKYVRQGFGLFFHGIAGFPGVFFPHSPPGACEQISHHIFLVIPVTGRR